MSYQYQHNGIGIQFFYSVFSRLSPMYEKEDANLNTATLKSSTETLRLPFPCPAFSCCAIM